jgi:hypothetical protein
MINTVVQIYEGRGLGFGDVSNIKLLTDGLGAPPHGVMRLTSKAVEGYRKNVDMRHGRALTAADFATSIK